MPRAASRYLRPRIEFPAPLRLRHSAHDFVKGFFLFWYDFIVGDCWQVALGVVLVLGLGAWLARTEAVSRDNIPPIVGVGIVAVVLVSLLITSKPKAKH